MARILIGWELGLNLGHLGRLLRLAARLKKNGHPVLVVARDVASAAAVLGTAEVSFIQAPHLPQGIPLPHRATGYADILLSQGWGDRSVLWGLVQSWINLFRMFRPDVVVLDYSPTAQLATRIAGIPSVLVGNGFELPPTSAPLPPFPGFSWATADQAATSEHIAVTHANAVAAAFKRSGIEALRDLFEVGLTRFATFQELDHYDPRTDATYIGPLRGKIRTNKIDWAARDGKKIFVCVRPDTQNVESVLAALARIHANVVCVAPGFTASKLAPFLSERIRFETHPVDLDRLAMDADLCVTYGAEGTIATFLMAGIPQLVLPWQVESHMAARRIEAIGAGLALRGKQSSQQVVEALDRLLTERDFRTGAHGFMQRNQHVNSGDAADALALQIIRTGSTGSVANQVIH